MSEAQQQMATPVLRPEAGETAESPEMQAAREQAEARARVERQKRTFVRPAELAEKVDAIGQVMADCARAGIPTPGNHDFANDVPEGFGIVMVPLPKNKGKGAKRELQALAIGIAPSFETVEAHVGGPQFIQVTTERAITNKFANQVRNSLEPDSDTKVPVTTAEFITSLRGGESLDAFKAVAPAFVKALQGSVPGITEATLRRALEVAAFARETFINQPADSWPGIIDMMIAEAAKLGKEPGALATWKETRDTAHVDESTFTLDGLAAALAAGDSDDSDDSDGEDA